MKTNIYKSGVADNLVNPAFFTQSIRHYQQSEKELLLKLADPYSTVIEVGCTKGRYTNTITKSGKNYIGIDIAGHHISDARVQHKNNEKATFFCEDIHNIQTLFSIHPLPENSILFFPFNCFGNLFEPARILEKIKNLGLPFIIFTYSTGPESSQKRSEYYGASGFENLRLSDELSGTRFTDNKGLNTMAYNENWFREAFVSLQFRFNCTEFGSIGKAYYNF